MNAEKYPPPLVEEYAIYKFLNDEYSVGRDFIKLLQLTISLADAALKKGERYHMGYLFGNQWFIRAVRAIKDINADGTVYTYGVSWSETWKTLWGRLCELITAHGQICKIKNPYRIPASAISEKWDKPLDTDKLKSLFDYCRYAAQRIYPNDKEAVMLYYDTGVFNIPLANYKGIQRLETGMQQAHREHEEIKSGIERIENGVQYLVDRDLQKRGKRIKAGKESQEKRDNTDRERARADKNNALKKVHKRVTDGEEVMTACRMVCKNFKLVRGATKYNLDAEYESLKSERGKPLKAASLARYYRERYNK